MTENDLIQSNYPTRHRSINDFWFDSFHKMLKTPDCDNFACVHSRFQVNLPYWSKNDSFEPLFELQGKQRVTKSRVKKYRMESCRRAWNHVCLWDVWFRGILMLTKHVPPVIGYELYEMQIVPTIQDVILNSNVGAMQFCIYTNTSYVGVRVEI